MNSLRWVSSKGDESIEWDPEDQASIEKAKSKFDELTKKGFKAFKVIKEEVTRKGEQIKEFDPSVKEILMTAPMAGG